MPACADVRDALPVGQLDPEPQEAVRQLLGAEPSGVLVVEDGLRIARLEPTGVGDELELDAGRVGDGMRQRDDAAVGTADDEPERDDAAQLAGGRPEPVGAQIDPRVCLFVPRRLVRWEQRLERHARS